MTTATRTTKAATITRTIDLSDGLNGLVLATVTEIAAGRITDALYWIRRQSSDFGLAFTVEKAADGTVYDVLLNAPGGGHACDCPHGTYRPNSKPCRHVECCLQAIRECKL